MLKKVSLFGEAAYLFAALLDRIPLAGLPSRGVKVVSDLTLPKQSSAA
jgi:hypothetical protein